MIHLTLLALSLLSAAPTAPELDEYEQAAARVADDPEANVKLALWCEAHGLTAEKLKHLGKAILGDPGHATARGLLGLVSYGGGWRSPEAVGEAVRSDRERAAALAEYNLRRNGLKNTAEANWNLALWCEERGLKAEATAHLTAVVRLDPARQAAWKRLGYRRENGRWATPALLAAEKAEREAQKRAKTHWRANLSKLRQRLGDPRTRAEAERELLQVTDPRAVPAIWGLFASRSEPDQLLAVGLLGQIDAGAASRALAVLCVASDSAEVRRRAIETLKNRDGRDYLGLLVNLVRKPIKYQVKPVAGPGSPGSLFVEGKTFNVQRNYVVPALNMRALARLYDPSAPFEPFSPQNVQLAMLGMMGPPPAPIGSRPPRQPLELTLREAAAERDIEIAVDLQNAQRATYQAQRLLAADVASLEAANSSIERDNQRVLPALNSLTGQDLGEEPDAWRAWWVDQRGYAYSPPDSAPVPTVQQVATFAFDYLQLPGPLTQAHNACFAAGTPVQTLEGLRPIESIRAGDQLLTQDTVSGTLSFQPVVQVFHNRPAATLTLDFGDGESIVATGIHRFWKAGSGWTMARDLKAGDAIRTVGGTAEVRSAQPERVQPVFNLEVARGRSFFVGKRGILVHDNTLVETVDRPFDAPPASLEPTSASSGR